MHMAPKSTRMAYIKKFVTWAEFQTIHKLHVQIKSYRYIDFWNDTPLFYVDSYMSKQRKTSNFFTFVSSFWFIRNSGIQ